MIHKHWHRKSVHKRKAWRQSLSVLRNEETSTGAEQTDVKIGAGCSTATAIPFALHSPTVNKHRRLFSFSFPYHSPSEVAVANDGSPRGTGSSRTHCKFAISGFNSVVITFVAHIYSREMFRYGASCNALYLSGYLLCYFLRDRIAKCIYVLSTNIIYTAKHH